MKDDITEFADQAPELTRQLIEFVIELAPDAGRAAVLLLVAAHTLTRYYDTPSFEDLILLVKASTPKTGN